MATHTETIEAFVRYLTLGEDRTIGTRKRDLIPNAPNVVTRLHANELYSYGTHFPLARLIPAKSRKPALWLINGDVWRGHRSTTDEHQADTRREIATAIADAAKVGKRVESLIVPFSALTGAGIDYATVRPLDIRPDRRELFTNEVEMPRALFQRPVMARELAEQAYGEWRKPWNKPNEPAELGSVLTSETIGRFTLDIRRRSLSSGIEDRYSRSVELSRSIVWRGYDHGCNANNYVSGWLDHEPAKVTYWLDHAYSPSLAFHNDASAPDAYRVTWQTERHWLGDSLFVAERLARGKRQRMRFLSSFDYNEPQPLYFLAALPRSSKATTIAQAVADLMPASVAAAIERGAKVERQGDIFLVPTNATDADIRERATARARLTQWTRGAMPKRGEVGYRAPMSKAAKHAHAALVVKLTRAAMREAMAADRRPQGVANAKRERGAKRAEILATIARHEARIAAGEAVCQCSTEYNASGVACVDCGLPRFYYRYDVASATQGLDRARADLAAWQRTPRARSVSGYCHVGRRPVGQCYSRALSAWQDAKRKANERYAPVVDTGAIRRVLAIHGTAHTATEVAILPGNATYVRGTVRHDPSVAGERRGRDHAAVKLADGIWYLAVRNTVPRG